MTANDCAKRASTPLVSVAQLGAHLDDSNWIVVDCRFDLMDPAAGHRSYQRSHVRGAYYADLNEDLAAPVQPHSGGRHPLPTLQDLERLTHGWGLQPGSRVVVYDDSGGAVAARLWWLLRWAGVEGASVLDGGWQAWLGAQGATDCSTPKRSDGQHSLSSGHMPVVNGEQVAQGVASGALLLLDARLSERFAGRTEPIDAKAGHVPGAVNAPFQQNLADDGRFLPQQNLAEHYRNILGNHPVDAVACMCGSGVTACHTLLALTLAGYPGAALYVGSWSDWISAGRPIATDA